MAAPAKLESQPPKVIDLLAWDAEISKTGANYEKLYEQISQASKDSPENVEILSRLAQATFLVTLNMNDPKEIKAKTTESLEIAEKVVAKDSNNFRGHLWQAAASGKIALLGVSVPEKIKYSIAFLRALAVCIRLNPKDPMVLFMEGRFALALSSLTEEEKAAIRKELPLPDINWAEAEAKLRESIAINGALIDGYVTLAYLLVKMKKYAEAKEVIVKGLSQQLVTKSDQEVAQELKSLQTRINNIVPQ